MTMQLLEKYLFDAEKAFEQEQYFDGKSILEDALVEEPTFGKAHNHMGWLYLYQFNDVEMAETHLNLALKYAPKDGAPYIHMASLYFDQGRLKELEELLDMASHISAVPKAFLYNELGRLNEVKGHYRTAILNYRKAIKWSMNDQEIAIAKDNINRCRNKRWFFFW